MFRFGKKQPTKPDTWEREYEIEAPHFAEMLKEDVFEGWSRIKDPSGLGSGVFFALRILFARGDFADADACLQRAILRVHRALDEQLIDKCAKETPGVNALFCESSALKSLAYARLILEGKIDVDLLTRSASLLKEGIKPEFVQSYLDPIEYDMLTIVTLFVICGQKESAAEILSLVESKKQVYNKYYLNSLRGIVQKNNESVDLDPLKNYIALSSYPSFSHFFPEHLSIAPSVHQFELGLLYCVISGFVTLDNCDYRKIVDIVNPKK